MLNEIKASKTGNNLFFIFNVVVLIFIFIFALFSGIKKDGNDSSVSTTDAVALYYERMPDDLYKIPEAELKELVDAGNKDIYILDIRETKDYNQGHIPGAHNIPFKKIGENLDKLPTDKTIIVYCYTGQTGGQTTAALNIAGFTAKSLNGGMNNGWAKASYDVVTGN